MPEQSLKQRTYIGFIWNFIDRFSFQFIQIALQLILMKILLPSDFGLIGTATIFLIISSIFVDSGLSNALIQKKDRTEVDFSTVFYFNLSVCLICYLIIFICAPYISIFFNTPELTPVIRVLFLKIVIGAFASVQSVKLRIALEFRKTAVCNLLAVVISGGVGVWMAYSGYGVWALVSQSILSSIVSLIVLTAFVRWKPLLVFSKTSFKKLFGFGSKLLGASLIDGIADQLYIFMLGRYYTKDQVGFYTRGILIPTTVSSFLLSVIEHVTYPVLTSIQDNREYMISISRRLYRMVSFLNIPAMVGLAFIAEPFVRYILTDKWMPAVVLMQWICFARIFTPMCILNLSLLNAIGRSDFYLKINLIRFPLVIIALVIAIPYGLKAIIISQFIMAVINFLINSTITGRMFKYGTVEQIKDMFPAILYSAIMFVVLVATTSGIHHDLTKIIVSIVVGVMSYLIVSILFKSKEIAEIRLLLMDSYMKIRKEKKS